MLSYCLQWNLHNIDTVETLPCCTCTIKPHPQSAGLDYFTEIYAKEYPKVAWLIVMSQYVVLVL